MKLVAIRTLYFVAAWFAVSSVAAAEPKSQYGGFSPDADGHQAYLDYIHSLDMLPVEAGDELQQAVDAMLAFNYVSLGNLYAKQDGGKQRALAEWLTALRLFKQLGMEMQSQAVIKAIAA